MADSAAPPAPQSPKKAVKKRAPAKPAAHPPFKDMIKAAIANLKERNGSSRQKITKYILSNYKGLGDEAAAKRHIKMALKTGVSSGALLHTKGVGASGSFKLSKVAKAAPKRRLQLKRSLLPRRQPRNLLPKNPRQRKPRNQQQRRQRTPKQRNQSPPKSQRQAKNLQPKNPRQPRSQSASQNPRSLPKRGPRSQARLERRSKFEDGTFEHCLTCLW